MRKAIAFAVLLFAVPASAQCVWKWDCTGGQCRQVPICRNVYDIPPPRPMELPPLAPLPTLKPLEPLTLPPLGTRQCQQRYICQGGQCVWRVVCE